MYGRSPRKRKTKSPQSPTKGVGNCYAGPQPFEEMKLTVPSPLSVAQAKRMVSKKLKTAIALGAITDKNGANTAIMHLTNVATTQIRETFEKDKAAFLKVCQDVFEGVIDQAGRSVREAAEKVAERELPQDLGTTFQESNAYVTAFDAKIAELAGLADQKAIPTMALGEDIDDMEMDNDVELDDKKSDKAEAQGIANATAVTATTTKEKRKRKSSLKASAAKDKPSKRDKSGGSK